MMRRAALLLALLLTAPLAAQVDYVSAGVKRTDGSDLYRVRDYVTLPACTPWTLAIDSDADTDGALYLCTAAGTFKSAGGAGDITGVTAGTGLTGGGASGGVTVSLSTPVAVANGGTGLTALSADLAAWLGTASSANLRTAVTDESGTGALLFAGGALGAANATSITAATAASGDLGSAALPFKYIYLAGDSGTPGTNNFKLTGTPTGARVVTFPDGNITVARIDNAQTFSGLQSFGSGIAVTGNIRSSDVHWVRSGTSTWTAGDGTNNYGGTVRLANANGASAANSPSAGENLTLSTSGTTTATAANLAPANSLIRAITARVTTTITTATDWSVAVTAGVASCTTAWVAIGTTTAAQTGLTAGTTVIFVPASGLSCHVGSASTLTVTTTGTPGAGAVRMVPFFETLVPPTS